MADKPTSSKSRKQRAQAEQVEQAPAPRPQPAEAAQTVEQFVTEKATQAAQKRRVEAALSVLDGAGDDKARAKALRALLDGSDPEDRKAIRKALSKLGGAGQPAAKVNPDDELSKDWKDGGYPYANLLRRSVYEKDKFQLQVELLKLQAWVKETGQRVVIIFEGRDAAGKGGTIKRFMEHLNPVVHAWWRWKSLRTSSAASGTSSAMCSTCPRRERSCCLTAAGTTVRAWSG